VIPGKLIFKAIPPARAFGISGAQEHLIRAALLSGPQALQAWKSWIESRGLEIMERGSYFLLPALYQNLNNLQAGGDSIPKIKGVYKRTWLSNHIVIKRFFETAQVFAREGIIPIPLAGLAGLLGIYDEQGLRPITRLALAIDPSQIKPSCAAVQALGYKPVGDLTPNEEPKASYLFTVGSRLRLELCCCPIPHLASSQNRRPYWPVTDEMVSHGIKIKTMKPADSLFCALVRDSRWRNPEPLAWLVDAATLIQKGNIDWDRLIHLARSTRSGLILTYGLSYINNLLPGHVPDFVLDKIKQLPVTISDVIEFLDSWVPSGEQYNSHGFKEIFLRKVQSRKHHSAWSMTLGAAREYLRHKMY
jgi:hypothetical protein